MGFSCVGGEMERLLVPVFFQGEGSEAIRGCKWSLFFFPSVIVFGEFIVLSAEFYCSVLKKVYHK